MKKIIAIMVVFALLTTAAFAIDVRGQVVTGVTVIAGDLEEDSDMFAGASINRLRITASGETEDGKFGGWARVDYFEGFSGYTWWQPIDEFKLIIGSNGGDCFFYKDGVTTWGFHEHANNTGVAIEKWAFWGTRAYGNLGPFFGGFGTNGVMMEIKPIDGLDVNLIIPFDYEGHAGNFYRGTIAQFDYTYDTHNFALTYEGNYTDRTNGTLYVYYGFETEEGFGIDVGLAYELENENNKGANDPIMFGIGFSNMFSDDFGLKARALGAIKTFDIPIVGEVTITNIIVDVLPSYVINSNITAFIGLGCEVGLSSAEGSEATFDWTFNPYISVGGNFFAGIQVFSDGDVINWSVPIGLNIRF